MPALNALDAPTVSIVLPTYNGERYLRRSLDSCFKQTWRDLEVIVVVDGSTDGTRSILATYDDPRMRVIDRKANMGLPESLNEGFESTRGHLLTWTSDDNEFLPSAIEEMVNTLRAHPEADLVYASYLIVNEHDQELQTIRATDPGSIWERNIVGACFLYTRRLATAVGLYRPEKRLIEDYDYWVRAHKRFRFVPLDNVLYIYRDHSQSLSGKINLLARSRAVVRLNREHRGISLLAYARQLAEIDIAEAFAIGPKGQPSKVIRLLLRGIVINPQHLLNRGVLSLGLKALRAYVGA